MNMRDNITYFPEDEYESIAMTETAVMQIKGMHIITPTCRPAPPRKNTLEGLIKKRKRLDIKMAIWEVLYRRGKIDLKERDGLKDLYNKIINEINIQIFNLQPYFAERI